MTMITDILGKEIATTLLGRMSLLVQCYGNDGQVDDDDDDDGDADDDDDNNDEDYDDGGDDEDDDDDEDETALQW